MSSTVKLSELAPGETARIESLEHEKKLQRRLGELGFCPGETVEALFSAVFGSPTAYMVQNTVIALRRSEAEKIHVKPL